MRIQHMKNVFTLMRCPNSIENVLRKTYTAMCVHGIQPFILYHVAETLQKRFHFALQFSDTIEFENYLRSRTNNYLQEQICLAAFCDVELFAVIFI